jgi:hypothetical protein
MKNPKYSSVQKNTELGKKRYLNEKKRLGKIYGRPKNHIVIKGEEYFLIEAPTDLNIYNTDKKQIFIDTIKFANEIKNSFGKSNVILDFTNTDILNAAVIVLLYSSISDIVKSSKYKYKIRLSKNPKVNKLLQISNFKKMVLNSSLSTNLESMPMLPVVSGTKAEFTEEIIDYIQFKIYKNNLSPDDEAVLSNAVLEAVENVALHAYPNTYNDEERQWWMICEVLGDQLYLVIQDRGVGIPATVKSKNWFANTFKSCYPIHYAELYKNAPPGAKLLDLLNINPIIKDSNLIYLSMQGEYSQTENKGRGQGSKSIKTLVTENESGKLWIYSNNGLYIQRSNEAEPELYDLPSYFPGTLIQWNIRIQ